MMNSTNISVHIPNFTHDDTGFFKSVFLITRNHFCMMFKILIYLSL